MVTPCLPAWSPMARCEDDGALLLGARRALAGKGAERRMQRARQPVGAERIGAVDRPFHVGDALAARRGVRRDQVHRRVAHGGDRRALQADAVEHLAEPPVVVRRALEDRDLDAVIAGRLDVLEQVLVLRRDVGRPQEHAEADFHDVSPPRGQRPGRQSSRENLVRPDGSGRLSRRSPLTRIASRFAKGKSGQSDLSRKGRGKGGAPARGEA